MAKIAVDIAILLPDPIMDLSIDLNRHMHEKEIILNKRDCLPHVSFFMGVIDEKDVPRVEVMLREIADNRRKISLIIVDAVPPGVQGNASYFEIKKTSEITRLFESIKEGMEGISKGSAESSMFCGKMISDSLVGYVNSWPDMNSENFNPHITLGYGKPERVDLPIQFTASRIALCQLGDHCTCKKILTSVQLL